VVAVFLFSFLWLFVGYRVGKEDKKEATKVFDLKG
jgi:hypothetical protein